jgi:hypothetical protein
MSQQLYRDRPPAIEVRSGATSDAAVVPAFAATAVGLVIVAVDS